MIKRREFLQSAALTASALPLLSSPLLHGAALSEQNEISLPPIYKFIYDQRFPAGVAQAGKLRQLGLASYGITGDITDLWYLDLYYRWREGPAAIAGMTAHGALFCLERLAWDVGMRVLSRSTHPSGAKEEPIYSWIIAPAKSAARYCRGT